MAKLTEFDTAARIKEVIYQIAGRAIDDVYPRPRYATVTAVNHAAGRVTLVYPDDATTFSLPTMMIAPEVGGIVRVAGQEGTRYVDEILTGSVRVRGALNLTNALVVAAGGATITGGLVIASGSTFQFGPTNTNAMYYLDQQGSMPWMAGPRLLGTNGWSFYNTATASDVMGYRGGIAGHYGWYSNRLLVGSTPSDAITTHTLVVNGNMKIINAGAALDFLGTNAYIQFLPTAGTPRIGYIQALAGGLTLAVENFGSFSINSTSIIANCGITLTAGGLGASASAGSQIYSNKLATGATAYNNQTFYANASPWGNSTATTGVGFYAYGTAGSFVMDASYAGCIMKDVPGSGYYTLAAAAFAVGSSRRLKQDIAPWPPVSGLGLSADEQPIVATDIVRRLNVVSFRNREDQMMVEAWPTERRAQAHARLVAFQEARGIEPYPYKIHNCDESECAGSGDDHCGWKKDWQQQKLGLIVEDTVDIAPELILRNSKGVPDLLNMSSYVALLHAAIKEMEERIAVLEGVT